MSPVSATSWWAPSSSHRHRGPKTFTVTGTDAASNPTVVVHNYTVNDVTQTVVVFTSPIDAATFDQNDAVLAAHTCTDEVGGSGVATCIGDV